MDAPHNLDNRLDQAGKLFLQPPLTVLDVVQDAPLGWAPEAIAIGKYLERSLVVAAFALQFGGSVWNQRWNALKVDSSTFRWRLIVGNARVIQRRWVNGFQAFHKPKNSLQLVANCLSHIKLPPVVLSWSIEEYHQLPTVWDEPSIRKIDVERRCSCTTMFESTIQRCKSWINSTLNLLLLATSRLLYCLWHSAITYDYKYGVDSCLCERIFNSAFR